MLLEENILHLMPNHSLKHFNYKPNSYFSRIQVPLLHIKFVCTAKICSGSTGFSLCTNPTAVSLHFLQTNNANIECKNCKKIFTVGCL